MGNLISLSHFSPSKSSNKPLTNYNAGSFEIEFILNADKTTHTTFSRARNIADDGLHITTWTRHSIGQVSEYKYLGVVGSHTYI